MSSIHDTSKLSLKIIHFAQCRKVYVTIFLIFISSILIDSLCSDFSSIINKSYSQSFREFLFEFLILLSFFSGLYVILISYRNIKSEFGSRSAKITLMNKYILFVQIIIIAFLEIISLQILISSQYITIFFIVPLLLSWIGGVVVLGIMTFKFIQWYSRKNNWLVLLYLISTAMFGGTLGSTIIPQTIITIQNFPFFIDAHSHEIKPFQTDSQNPNPLFAIISIANWLVIPLWYIVWAAAVFMLKYYSSLIGKYKYILIISLPLTCAIIGDISWLVFLPQINSIFDDQVIIYTLIAFGGLISGGFLLSFAFMQISREVIKKTKVNRISKYLLLSSQGVAILFVSFFANPSSGSYLPFGVIAASFFCYGTFLYFMGIYSTALYITSDQKIKQIIRNSVLEKSKLLDTIGLADLKDDIDREIKVLFDDFEKNSNVSIGIDHMPSESEMKEYALELLSELKNKNGHFSI